MRPILDTTKIEAQPTADQMLSGKYGMPGTPGREDFDAKAMAWYYADVLKEARKSAGMTQKQLADKIGKKREYIAQLEKGETDMQLSTFLMISQAVGLNLSLSRI